MKVWLVLPDYGYEGYGEPIAVFSCKEAAEKRAAAYQEKYRYFGCAEIFELELDDTAD